MVKIKKEGDKLEELTKVFNEILRVSRKYSYLWEDDALWKKENKWDFYNEDKKLNLALGWIAQDEMFSIDVQKYQKRILIGGQNFDYEPCQKGGGLTARQAALRLEGFFKGYNIPAEHLRKNFYLSLKKPLGKYLANKSLEGLIKNEISMEPI